MSAHIGLWIDHRNAIIVSVTDQGATTKRVASEVESQPRRTGDSPLHGTYEALQVPADDRKQRVLTAHLGKFYDAVAAELRGADTVLIMGPGEAKGELKKHLQDKHLDKVIVGVETADKMSDHDIAERIRSHLVSSRAT